MVGWCGRENSNLCQVTDLLRGDSDNSIRKRATAGQSTAVILTSQEPETETASLGRHARGKRSRIDSRKFIRCPSFSGVAGHVAKLLHLSGTRSQGAATLSNWHRWPAFPGACQRSFRAPYSHARLIPNIAAGNRIVIDYSTWPLGYAWQNLRDAGVGCDQRSIRRRIVSATYPNGARNRLLAFHLP
jgi:hypothetical protein